MKLQFLDVWATVFTGQARFGLVGQMVYYLSAGMLSSLTHSLLTPAAATFVLCLPPSPLSPKGRIDLDAFVCVRGYRQC